MKIMDLSPDERPREKMVRIGASALSNAELLAILLRTGYGELNAIDLGRALLQLSGGGLIQLSSLSVERICAEVYGIGESKAITIAAAFELGRRFSLEGFMNTKPTLNDSRSVYLMMRPVLLGLKEEQCWSIGVNRSKGVLFREMVSKGSINTTILNERRIVQTALEKNAFGIIVVHNHPSGNPRPSPDDIERTGHLSRLLSSVNVVLIDHVIVSDGSYFSFSDDLVSKDDTSPKSG